eukprot:CAMPEP_0119018626 /NCGR_PEP_ID=MMETSP1176-20130426/19884_1 /TAXON_ID=265551 /ORGANISM="Synedropsis recta cf, Strain CCMP1620" /LENGTH=383 /DNA_ID=CAMNT_0006972661 /DNA_START=197 /DNA_END=1345 /DNA_ORIENTATION=+
MIVKMAEASDMVIIDIEEIPCLINSHEDSEHVPLRGLHRSQCSRSLTALPGMRIFAHSIDSAGELHTCEPEEALKAGAVGGGGSFWIDVDADERDEEELREWLQSLHLSPFLTSRLAEPAHTWNSHVIALRSSSLAIIRILPWREDAPDTLHHLAALKSKGLLLTFTSSHRHATGGLGAAAMKHMEEPECIPQGSSSGALLAWLLFHVERTAQFMREVRTCTVELDNQMDKDPTSVSLDDVIDVKDRLLRVLSVAEEQAECVATLTKVENDSASLDFSKIRGTLGVLVATSECTERMGLRIEKRISDLRQTQEAYQQDRINKRLAVLTVLSAIFLPLTLIAGIYGMNFDNMPELHRQNAYFYALGMMVAIALTMLVSFYRCGW